MSVTENGRPPSGRGQAICRRAKGGRVPQRRRQWRWAQATSREGQACTAPQAAQPEPHRSLLRWHPALDSAGCMGDRLARGPARRRSLSALSRSTSTSKLPPVTDLLDGRARGSVTLLDRNGEVFAWRGETFGGQIDAQHVSPNLRNAIDRHRGPPLLLASRCQPARHHQRDSHQSCRRTRATRRQRRLDHHPAGREASLPRRRPTIPRSGSPRRIRGRLPRRRDRAQAQGNALRLRAGGEVFQERHPVRSTSTAPILARERAGSRPQHSATSAKARTPSRPPRPRCLRAC